MRSRLAGKRLNARYYLLCDCHLSVIFQPWHRQVGRHALLHDARIFRLGDAERTDKQLASPDQVSKWSSTRQFGTDRLIKQTGSNFEIHMLETMPSKGVRTPSQLRYLTFSFLPFVLSMLGRWLFMNAHRALTGWR